MNNTQHNLTEALQHITIQAGERDKWLSIGTALKNENYPFDLFDSWSQTQAGYNAKNIRSEWNSFNKNSNCNLLNKWHVFKEAQRNGYVVPKEEHNQLTFSTDGHKAQIRYEDNASDIFDLRIYDDQPAPESVEPQPAPQQTLTDQQKKDIQIMKEQAVIDISNNQTVLDYLSNRGIKLETAIKYGVGSLLDYGTNDIYLLFPTERFYANRCITTTEKSKRFKTLKPKSCLDLTFDKELFNGKALEDNPNCEPIFVCEGQFDALTILQEGYRAVSVNGAQAQNTFIEKYKQSNKPPLVICFDNDQAGEKATQNLRQSLLKVTDKGNIQTMLINPLVKDVNENYTFDAGEVRKQLKALYRNFIPATKEELIEEYHSKSAKNLLDDFDNDNNPFNMEAIRTGFKSLDQVLNGGVYQGLYILGADTGRGKTTFMLQIMDYIAQQGHDVLIFTLEMSTLELIARSLSRHTFRLPQTAKDRYDDSLAKTELQIRKTADHKRWTEEEKQNFQKAREEYGSYAGRIHIIEGIGNISAVDVKNAILEHINLTGNVPVVMVDYLQIMAPIQSERYTEIREALDKNILELKRTARDYNVPIFALSSQNRSGNKGTKEKANNSNFKESSGIEYTASVTMQLVYPEASSKEFEEGKKGNATEPRNVELHIIKNRQGRGSVISFAYVSMFSLFLDKGIIPFKKETE